MQHTRVKPLGSKGTVAVCVVLAAAWETLILVIGSKTLDHLGK